MAWGLTWWSSGQDSTLPRQGAWVQSLVREPDPTWHNKGSQAVTKTSAAKRINTKQKTVWHRLVSFIVVRREAQRG